MTLSSVSALPGGKRVIDAVDLVVRAADRLALAGHNGCGKSTLLSILAGALEPDEGARTTRRGLRLAMVEQFLPEALAQVSVREAVASVVPEAPWRADAVLAKLGFDEARMALPVASLSGGQENRVMFARALVAEPELLLLDEPTNHLDLPTLLLFEQLLQDFPGAIVLVSHDRAFLDTICTRTAFIDAGRVRAFDLPYSDARDAMAEQDIAAAEALASEEREIAQIRRSAKRLAEWGKTFDNEKFSRRARNMARRADRLEAEKTEVSAGSPLDLGLALSGSRARQALAIDDRDVAVAGRHLFTIDSLTIRPGERVALLGANGVGKSTFIRALMQTVGQEDAHIRFNPQTQLGYYDQELTLTDTADGMFAFMKANTTASDLTARRTLVAAGFPYEVHATPLRQLSGGERARVLFAVLSLQRPNFLILDEPTNHIDIDGKEQLEETLCSGDATLLVTSHDRRFLEEVAQRFLLISGGALSEQPSLEACYEGMAPAARVELAQTAAEPVAETADPLERIEALEALLAADLARKPKFQKPERQAEWREEIERLYSELD